MEPKKTNNKFGIPGINQLEVKLLQQETKLLLFLLRLKFDQKDRD